MEKEFTSEDAIRFAEEEAWKDMTLEERAKFQMTVKLSCMPFSVFHEAIEDTLGRPVWTHEFGVNWEGIEAELFDGAPTPSMDEIVDLIPEDKKWMLVVL